MPNITHQPKAATAPAKQPRRSFKLTSSLRCTHCGKNAIGLMRKRCSGCSTPFPWQARIWGNQKQWDPDYPKSFFDFSWKILLRTILYGILFFFWLLLFMPMC